MRIPSRRSGVSAVISALLMIAVAVSLSAALFLSTTGYLGGLTTALGNQQPVQSQAAQAAIVVENTGAKAFSTGYPSDGWVLLFVRNVGGVNLNLGSISVTAPPTNAGVTKSFSATLSGGIWSQPYGSSSGVYVCSEATTSSTCEASCSAASSSGTLTRQSNTVKVLIKWCNGTSSPTPKSGDALQIQVSSTVGASNIVTVSVP